MRSLRVALLLALASCVVLPASAQETRRSIFGCVMRNLKTDTPTSPAHSFAFMLSGEAGSVDEKAPIETYDPSGLLDGASFKVFVRVPAKAGGGYGVATDGTGGGKHYLLSIGDRGEDGLYALFGVAGEPPAWGGHCVGLQSSNPKADFMAMKSTIDPQRGDVK